MIDQYVIDNLGVTAHIFTWYWAWFEVIAQWRGTAQGHLVLIYWTNLARIGNVFSGGTLWTNLLSAQKELMEYGLLPIWTTGVVMDIWHLTNMMTKKGEVESESGKSVRKVNCKRSGKLDQWQGVMSFIPRGLHSNSSLANNIECFAQFMFQDFQDA